jgi:hypothetical protein
MADEKAPERSAGPFDVTVVSVSPVLPAIQRRPLRERLAGVGVRTFVAAAAACAALGAIVAIGLQSSQAGRPAGANRAGPHGAQRPWRAAAFEYQYPLRCMSMGISNINPIYVAEVERANGCAGYSRDVTASFQRTDGRWTLVLGEGLSLGCLSLAVVIHDPTFIGPDRAVCSRGRLAWLR